MTKSRKTEDADGVNIIAEWPRKANEVVRVSLTRYRGRHLIDVRIWYLDENSKYKAGRSGITLSVGRHLLQLANALAMALRRATKFGLLPNESATKRAGGHDA